MWNLKGLSSTIENLNLLLLLLFGIFQISLLFHVTWNSHCKLVIFHHIKNWYLSRFHGRTNSLSLPLPLLSSFSRIFKPLCIQPTEKDTIRFSKLWKDSLNNGIVPSREQVNFVIGLGRKYEKVLSRWRKNYDIDARAGAINENSSTHTIVYMIRGWAWNR